MGYGRTWQVVRVFGHFRFYGKLVVDNEHFPGEIVKNNIYFKRIIFIQVLTVFLFMYLYVYYIFYKIK